MRISAYFQPEIYMQPANLKSKRLQNVVDKFLNPDAAKDTPNVNDPSKTTDSKQKGRKIGKKTTTNIKDMAEKDIVQVSDEKNEDAKKEDKNKNISDTDKIKKTRKPRKTDKEGNKTGNTKSVSKRNSKGRTKTENYVKEDEFSGDDTAVKESEISVIKKRSSNRRTKTVVYAELDDDDSSASSSDVTSGSDMDWSDSDSDIVEAGLDVSEILGLKIGRTLTADEDITTETDDKKPADSMSTTRVFVSGLNLDEIMNLESGEVEPPAEENVNVIEKWDTGLHETVDFAEKSKMSESAENLRNDNGNLIVKDGPDVEQKTDNVSDSEVDYTNEGGFFRDESGDEHESRESAENKSATRTGTKYDKDISHVQKREISKPNDIENVGINDDVSLKKLNQGVSVTSSQESSAGHRRSKRKRNQPVEDETTETAKRTKVVARKDKVPKSEISRVTENMKKKDPVENEDIEIVKRTRVAVSKDTVPVSEISEVNEGSKKKDFKTGKHSAKKQERLDEVGDSVSESNESENIKHEMVDSDDKVKEILQYNTNPIRRLVTGVPWEKRAAKRGRSTKGQGKGKKALQVEPKEKFQKKKDNAKLSRNPVGVVNLSESSSDSE